MLAAAERAIALLGRVRPLNYAEVCAALERAARRSERARVELRHAPAPDLSEVRRALQETAQRLDTEGELGALYAERARELDGDAALVQALGTAEFPRLARARQAISGGEERAAADALARSFANEPAEAEEQEQARVSSDDATHPGSLLNRLRREIGQRHLPLRVIIQPDLPSTAAVSEDAVLLRPGMALTERQAQRLTLHELFGHALPRLRSRSQRCGLFRVGSAGAEADEEGRALVLEQRAGLMDVERRRELGFRHLAALATADGAEPGEVVERLLELDCPLEAAVRHAVRAARGGGLCRELVYLPAWLRVEAAFAAEPELEPWLELGRVSVAAARRLRAFSACHSIAIELPSRPA